MLVMAGSASTHATEPPASASSTAARSLNSTATVVSAGSTGGPMLPARDTVPPPGWRTANVSSTEPW